MLVIQLSYSDSRMPVKRYYYFSYESVLDFLCESALWLRECMKHAVREGAFTPDANEANKSRYSRIVGRLNILSLLASFAREIRAIRA